MAEEPTEPIPDPSRFGPNYVEHLQGVGSEFGSQTPTRHYQMYTDTEPTVTLIGSEGSEWVDLMHEAPIDFSRPSPPLFQPTDHEAEEPNSDTMAARASTFGFVRRPKIFGPTPSEARESIPLRSHAPDAGEQPPHLRLQRAPPFVRPLTGFDHDSLGVIYSDIRTWRTQLKKINQEISAEQADAYADIADGARIRGWILIGRGLRFLPGIQMVEGRSKEDIRWDLLQVSHKERRLRWVIYWMAMIMSGLLLAIGRKPSINIDQSYQITNNGCSDGSCWTRTRTGS
jgi:calcium permeable stress-gated cation channel